MKTRSHQPLTFLRYSLCMVVSMITALVFQTSTAQDIHFSQFANSPLNLNPAQTGFFDGDQRFVANHRNQWKSVTTPYVTFSGSLESTLDRLAPKNSRLAGGLVFNNDRAGDSKMGTTSLMSSLALMKPIGRDSVHFVGVGVMMGFTLRSINYSALTFDEQFNGDVYDPTISNSESFDNNNHAYLDLGFGVNYVYQNQDGFRVGLGSAIQHLNRPDDGFFSEKVKLFPKLQNHFSLFIPVASRIQIQPSALLMFQGGYQELTLGSTVQYVISELPGRNYAFSAGTWIRAKDALIPYVGLRYNEFRFGLSYDVNTSDLDRASNGKGGYELSMSYIIKKVKSKGIKPPCPLY